MALAQVISGQAFPVDPLLTAEEVAERLKVSRDWVWITRPGDCHISRSSG